MHVRGQCVHGIEQEVSEVLNKPAERVIPYERKQKITVPSSEHIPGLDEREPSGDQAENKPESNVIAAYAKVDADREVLLIAKIRSNHVAFNPTVGRRSSHSYENHDRLREVRG